ncbi:MAG: hypothetical protein LBS48_01305, partial [Treponema sp.]|nr:hypothetical protein [Treponema sp.]
MEAGTYTVYASSADAQERAVAANVVVASGQAVTAEDLALTAVGNITGYVILDSNITAGNLGSLVFVAGTSYMAVTADNGKYTI